MIRRIEGIGPRRLGLLAVASLLATGLVIGAALADRGSSAAALALAQRYGIRAPGADTRPPGAAAAPGDPTASAEPPLGSPPLAQAPGPRALAAMPSPAVAPATAGGDTANAGDDPAGQSPSTTHPPPPTAPASPRPVPSRIGHVFVIALASRGLTATFGPATAAPYLAGTLRPAGTLLSGYVPVDPSPLSNRLALVSGQAPNAATRAGCPAFADFPRSAVVGRDGQVRGRGCVYPVDVLTIADQLDSAGKRWKAYAEDMDRGPLGERPCRRPAAGAADDTRSARPGDQYAVRDNPFAYFHSLLDLGACTTDDVALTPLARDLRRAATTPNLAWIAPNLCHDATDMPCVDGSPGGLPAADGFLREWVPRILRSPAYRHDGLLVVTFAGAPPGGRGTEPVGTLLVSPYVAPGGASRSRTGPYGLLRSLEDLFGLAHLGRAGARGVPSLPSEVLARAFADRAGGGD